MVVVSRKLMVGRNTSMVARVCVHVTAIYVGYIGDMKLVRILQKPGSNT